jgi:hypothetical protein
VSRIAIGCAIVLACAPARARAQLPSESAALGRSLWGTIVPIGVGLVIAAAAGNEGPDGNAGAGALGGLAFTGGLLVGPSLGYFYAGERGRAWRGVGLRVLGFGALIGAAAASWECYGSECETAGAVALVGSVVTLGSAIYDIATVRGAVRRRNERAQGVSVRVAPTYSSRQRAAGVALQLTF